MTKQKRKPIYCPDTKETFFSYSKYLEGIHWSILRAKKYILNHSCEFEGCSSTLEINIHHKTYKNLGNENIKDLITLCRHHHCKLHEDLKLLRKVNRKAIRSNYLINDKVYRLTPYRLTKLIRKFKLKGIYVTPIKLQTSTYTYKETSPLISLKCKLGMEQLPTIKPHKRSYLIWK